MVQWLYVWKSNIRLGNISMQKLTDKDLPWFTNSGGLLVLPALLWGSKVWFDVLIDEMLPWDWTALLSISPVLVLQKSSTGLGLIAVLPWIVSPFGDSYTPIISVGLLQHPRQPLLCYKSGLTRKLISTNYQLLRSFLISKW